MTNDWNYQDYRSTNFHKDFSGIGIRVSRSHRVPRGKTILHDTPHVSLQLHLVQFLPFKSQFYHINL